MHLSELWIAPVGVTESQSNGLILASTTLVGMVIALGYTGAALWRGFGGWARLPNLPPLRFAIPALAIAGLGIAGYLAYVEVGAVSAVCGPVGDCNAVQNSPYARLFGIPLGVVGLAGYIAILGAWLCQQRTEFFADQIPLIIFCTALFSVLFSIYLTYLEIFVIRAVCIWCLTSAVIVTLILLFSVRPLLQANRIVDK